MRALVAPRDDAAQSPIVALAPLALLTLVAFLVWWLATPATQASLIGDLINVVVVVGLYIFVGNSGIMSFGHISFMLVGAYATALLTIPVMQKKLMFPDFPHELHAILVAHPGALAAALIAAAFATVLALLLGYPLMRLSAFPAGMATLSLLIITYVVAGNWTQVTGGQNTVVGVPSHATVWTTWAVGAAAIVCAYLYQRSRHGLRLRASREDEFAASACGIRLVRERWIALALSAFWVALAGAMYAYYLPFSPDSFYLDITFITLAMLVIGGRDSLWGAVLGAVCVSALIEGLQNLESGAHVGPAYIALPGGTADIVVAVIMLVILILRPAGLTGGREVTRLPLPRRLRARIPSAVLPARTTGERVVVAQEGAGTPSRGEVK